jgi:glycerophosphoryl diester phosphodiesterase
VAECVAARVPRLEIDVRFLADDAMLIYHDASLDAETNGSGAVGAIDTAAARELRYRADPAYSPCFLEDVVDVMRGGSTLLQVDLKLMRLMSAERERRLVEALTPIRDLVLIGSQAHWNLRGPARAGLPVAFDPTLQWHYWPHARGENLTPSRLGVHGLWDDAPIAHIPYVAARDYFHSRLDDLLALLPAREWMVDYGTILHMAEKGFELGHELAHRGVELAAWTLHDTGPGPTSALIRRLFELGTTTIITDAASTLAGYARALSTAQ